MTLNPDFLWTLSRSNYPWTPLLECLIDLSHPHSKASPEPASPIVLSISVNVVSSVALVIKLGIVQRIIFLFLSCPIFNWLTNLLIPRDIQSIFRIWSFSPISCYILVQAFNHLLPELLHISLLVSLFTFLFLYNQFLTQQPECSSKIKTTACPSSASSSAMVPHVTLTKSNRQRSKIDLQGLRCLTSSYYT